ncbi:MAG: hypothetical protein WBS21_21950 [Candidatus Acidiferrum sp.]
MIEAKGTIAVGIAGAGVAVALAAAVEDPAGTAAIKAAGTCLPPNMHLRTESAIPAATTIAAP